MYREIEKKAFILGDPATLIEVVKKVYKYQDVIHVPQGVDLLWDRPNGYVRLREFGPRGVEMTVKKEDKGGVVDREEVNMDISSSIGVARKLTTSILGDPTVKIKGEHVIIKLRNDVVVSVSCTESLPYPILEIEGPSLDLVEYVFSEVSKVYASLALVDMSMFQLVINYARYKNSETKDALCL